MASSPELKEAFAAISAVPPSTLQQIAEEIIKGFAGLQVKLQSENEKERQAAIQEAVALKKRVRDLLVKTYKDAGVDITQVAESLKQHLGK